MSTQPPSAPKYFWADPLVQLAVMNLGLCMAAMYSFLTFVAPEHRGPALLGVLTQYANLIIAGVVVIVVCFAVAYNTERIKLARALTMVAQVMFSYGVVSIFGVTVVRGVLMGLGAA